MNDRLPVVKRSSGLWKSHIVAIRTPLPALVLERDDWLGLDTLTGRQGGS